LFLSLLKGKYLCVIKLVGMSRAVENTVEGCAQVQEAAHASDGAYVLMETDALLKSMCIAGS
jgi:hypothetical protein